MTQGNAFPTSDLWLKAPVCDCYNDREKYTTTGNLNLNAQFSNL